MASSRQVHTPKHLAFPRQPGSNELPAPACLRPTEIPPRRVPLLSLPINQSNSQQILHSQPRGFFRLCSLSTRRKAWRLFSHCNSLNRKTGRQEQKQDNSIHSTRRTCFSNHLFSESFSHTVHLAAPGESGPVTNPSSRSDPTQIACFCRGLHTKKKRSKLSDPTFLLPPITSASPHTLGPYLTGTGTVPTEYLTLPRTNYPHPRQVSPPLRRAKVADDYLNIR